MEKITGHEAVQIWNPTWKHHHIPLWLKKRIRPMAKKEGSYKLQSLNEFMYIINNESWSALFDHYGSAFEAGEKERFFATQPYKWQKPQKEAEFFAQQTGCSLEIIDPAPYGENATMYIFKPLSEIPKHAR